MSSPVELGRVCVQQAAEQKSLDQVAGFQKSLEAFSEGILLVDISTPDWNVLFQNEAWLGITGMSRDEVYGGKMWQLFSPVGQTKVHCVDGAFSLQASFEEVLVGMYRQSLDRSLLFAAAGSHPHQWLLVPTCCRR